MAKKISSNFYLIDGYHFQRITKEDREKMSEEERTYWIDKNYWYVEKKLPDGRLYSGNGFSHPTKLTAKDLPEDYILLTNYKKHGYIRASGVKDLIYSPSPFHNHAFKDDFLYISYTIPLGEYVSGWEKNSTYNRCDEYIFGNDIVNFIFAVEKWSPDYDVTQIKRDMVKQYNLYCDEMSSWRSTYNYKKIERLEELR